MPRGSKSQLPLPDGAPRVKHYKHTSEKRTNIPPAKIAGEGEIPKVKRVQYAYNPHLPPALRFDPTGKADRTLASLHGTIDKLPLQAAERETIYGAVAAHQPWLEWAGKREEHERGFFDVDPVALHIHERVSAQACVRMATREDVQRDLFADPELPYMEAVKFYRHDVDWANRLILGDSLQVMSSLARRENLAGKVQMIYMDPPYGIKFASNFQPEVGRRDVKEKEQDLTREAEMVKAYRDTWQLGVHSYLSYLRDRLIAARELLAETGSIFVQISDENVHRVRFLMDELFGSQNHVTTIAYKTAIGMTGVLIDSVYDNVVWYARDKCKVKFRRLFQELSVGAEGATRYLQVESKETGESRLTTEDERTDPESISKEWVPYRDQGLTSRTGSSTTVFPVEFEGRTFRPSSGGWRTNESGMHRAILADRILRTGNNISYKKIFEDSPSLAVANYWTDTGGGITSRSDPKVYVVQTTNSIIERCLLMTTDPGDLVLDPTCGSGTTAYVAEQWGRRWITIDTSRVAVSIARQRLLTAKYDFYDLRDEKKGPVGGFHYKTVPHITLKSIAQNRNLDPIFAKHEPILDERLASCNKAVAKVLDTQREQLRAKLDDKQKVEGKRAVTDADRRRWDLPTKFEHWTVPFDTDTDWPRDLADAVTAYRKVWRSKMDEVNACIASNADQEELVDQPRKTTKLLRVSGPFTVEGVMPEELNIGEEGLFDGTPNEFEEDAAPVVEVRNLTAYLTRMVQSLRADGLTFLGNKVRKFARVEPLFETGTGSVIHAEGAWEDSAQADAMTVAIAFGPQYGPVTARQVEDAIRTSHRYNDLVIAGFSFDAEASEVIAENAHPKLRIHQAYIRPDINPGMDGLLKETPRSQLFTVFGQPEVTVEKNRDGDWTVTLKGVDIYDPVSNTIRSTGAGKVAAWFLDQDYDGRCFCVTQAFFPDQDAWGKIAKALGSRADEEAFEAFKGTESLPFEVGKHGRIAVKVIDPRGNEVMAVRKLES